MLARSYRFSTSVLRFGMPYRDGLVRFVRGLVIAAYPTPKALEVLPTALGGGTPYFYFQGALPSGLSTAFLAHQPPTSEDTNASGLGRLSSGRCFVAQNRGHVGVFYIPPLKAVGFENPHTPFLLEL